MPPDSSWPANTPPGFGLNRKRRRTGPVRYRDKASQRGPGRPRLRGASRMHAGWSRLRADSARSGCASRPLVLGLRLRGRCGGGGRAGRCIVAVPCRLACPRALDRFWLGAGLLDALDVVTSHPGPHCESGNGQAEGGADVARLSVSSPHAAATAEPGRCARRALRGFPAACSSNVSLTTRSSSGRCWRLVS